MKAEELFIRDMEHISSADCISWNKLKNKTIFITGATGLIGYTIVNSLIYASKKRALNIKILALVRDLERAKARFRAIAVDNGLEYIVGNVENLPEIKDPVDYIIHGACQTASKAYVNQPIETIMTSLKGTENLLELAKKKKVMGMVYLSSMEVYGHPSRGAKLTEDEIGALVPLDVRNSYPISKVQCENLCCAYEKECDIPVMSVRLTQTFGPGIRYIDERIFAEFAKCIIEKRDIVLKTKGETERSYLYTADAVTAILTVLTKGERGKTYNAADESTYCSIAEMAEQVAKQGGINVKYEIQDESKNGYPKTLYMNLDTRQLRHLGWGPARYTISEMFSNMIIQCLAEDSWKK